MGRAQSWKEYRETGNKAEVFRQLEAMGYEVTKRTFYRHCKQGKCRTNSESLYSRRLLRAYVDEAGLLRAGETGEDDDGGDVALSIEKQEEEIAKLKWHNRTAELNYNKAAGLLIEREGVYLEMAARTVALDQSYAARVIEEEAPKMIAAVGGDMTKLPELQDLLRDSWDELMNSFCTTDSFEVLFEDEEDLTELLSNDVEKEEWI